MIREIATRLASNRWCGVIQRATECEGPAAPSTAEQSGRENGNVRSENYLLLDVEMVSSNFMESEKKLKRSTFFVIMFFDFQKNVTFGGKVHRLTPLVLKNSSEDQDKHGALVEWYWQGKPKLLEAKPVPVSVCLVKIKLSPQRWQRHVQPLKS